MGTPPAAVVAAFPSGFIIRAHVVICTVFVREAHGLPLAHGQHLRLEDEAALIQRGGVLLAA